MERHRPSRGLAARIKHHCEQGEEEGERRWDTHQDNFNALRHELLPSFDLGLSAFFDDLEARGMLDDVLVLVGDVPLLRADTVAALVAHHRDCDAAATLLTTHVDDPTGYGRIVRDATMLAPGDAITTTFANGHADSEVRKVLPGVK